MNVFDKLYKLVKGLMLACFIAFVLGFTFGWPVVVYVSFFGTIKLTGFLILFMFLGWIFDDGESNEKI